MKNKKNKNFEFDKLSKILLIVVLLVHGMFFILEALLWMWPEVYTPLIVLLNNPVSTDIYTQALTLKNLFINQGFYNLFLVIAGFWGDILILKQKYASGYAVLLVLCFSAAGAGLVLSLSTNAYLLALFQAAPAIWLFFRLLPKYQQAEHKR